MVNGRLLEGAHHIAGEWGHNPLPWPRDDERPGPACYCGRRGCIETFLSGPGLASDYARTPGRALGRRTPSPRRADGRRTGTRVEAMARYVRPDGPGAGHHHQRPRSRRDCAGRRSVEHRCRSTPASRHAGASTSSPTKCIRALVKARHGDSSGVRGAARSVVSGYVNAGTCGRSPRLPWDSIGFRGCRPPPATPAGPGGWPSGPGGRGSDGLTGVTPRLRSPI